MNTGALDHELYIGDERAQAAREQSMSGGATSPPDGPVLVGVQPGERKELTISFPAPGTTLVGCHLDSHYQAGMKATITIRWPAHR